MKAIVCTKYGPPQVLKLQEVNQPLPEAGEALIKIQAASLNAADLENMRGEFVVRIAAPFRPMYRILGTDFAGTIAAVGGQVKQFQPGNERVMAVIQPKPGCREQLTENEIKEFCKAKLPPYAVPRFIEFREDMPLTVTEKVFKRALRQEYIEKLGLT